MNTSQLMCVIHADPVLRASTLGVYAADQIPQTIRRGGFIANTDAISKPGRHWCAFFFDGNGRSEFFDSYGKSPEYYHNAFAACLEKNSSIQSYNCTKLQGNYSNVCGQYFLYFLINRSRGRRLNDIVATLENIQQRDQFVYNYISRRFPYCLLKITTNYNQTCFRQNKAL